MQKLTIEEDKEHSQQWPKTFHCRIEVDGRSGRKWSQHIKNPKGHPANPMNDHDIGEKFFGLTKTTLGHDQAKQVLDLLWDLEEIEDVRQILDALRI
jgi:2-methylcitrate dehydratase